ncbi:MAG: hypothetical protein U1E28_04965 [Beijerinckiaceae bacterium]
MTTAPPRTLASSGLFATDERICCKVATGLPKASLTYTPTDVLLTMTASLGGGGNLPPNPSKVVNAINAFFNTNGSLPTNFLKLFGLSGPGLQSTLNSLTGEAATGGGQVMSYAPVAVAPDSW